MCVNDWRIGNQIKTVLTQQVVAPAGYTVARNPNRVGIEFRVTATAGGGALTIVVDGAGLGAPGALGIQMGFIFTLLNHGDLPTKEFVLDTGAGTVTTTIIEWIAPTGLIAAGLNEFQRAYPGSYV